MILPDIRSIDVFGKRVFLRLDLDAPLGEFKVHPFDKLRTKFKVEVADDTRLVVGMPTLEYLLTKGATIVVGGHLRRPEGYDPKFSVKPVVFWLCQKLRTLNLELKTENGRWKIENEKLGGFEGWRLGENLFILENLRFYKEEKANDLEFAKKLADLADIYVNDAFASSHRSHASIVGVPKFLPHFAGFHMQKEIKVLSEILENPSRPLVVIIGGEKIETKLPLVSKMCQLSDNILVGGKIAQEIMLNPKIISEDAKKIRCAFLIAALNEKRTDITRESVDNFLQIVNMAKTIVWNGPVGIISSKFKVQSQVQDCTWQSAKFTEEDSEYGTWRLAKAISESQAYTIVGGGDTLEFLKQLGILNKFSFFSTGGGAMLSFLSNEKLPGIEALLE